MRKYPIRILGFEWKYGLKGSTDETLKTNEYKQYAAPFAMDARTIIKIGATFGSESRKMDEWKLA